ncbi:MAG TPA: transaldolase [Kofleriaceae bacterium]|jgi:transaldolase|nr:transaldolase [Kofleriaceae bacterium]
MTPDIKIFADGAVLDDVPRLLAGGKVKGFTTNPTLMAKAGVKDYERFARRFLEATGGLPVSLEVFADDIPSMVRQARILASWGDNVYVKVPVTNTAGDTTADAVSRLARDGVKLNVTAVFTRAQIDGLLPLFDGKTPAIISIFAGRIADAGVDPAPIMRHAVERVRDRPNLEILWASCREIFNVVTAAGCGCHVITVPNDMLGKLAGLGRDLTDVSLDTVKMFYNDAKSSGFQL